ncbi:MAG: hypothetical protein OXK20_05050 [Deltaproteobacteria bacterium]|nr:hypothetical protein [Deltaproteobacteria bacterium]
MTTDALGRQTNPDSEAWATHGLFRLVTHAVPAVLVFVVLLSFGVWREGGTAALLIDTDDFMRTVQVLDWLDGQGWNDMVQRRLNPPDGVAMHWSRLADMPLAAVIALCEPWFGRPTAVHLAAVLVPSLVGGLFAALFLWGAAALIPDRHAPLVVSMLPALVIPLLLMLPGRVDHHGLQLALTALAIGFLLRSLTSERPWTAVGLGVAAGVSLAVGLETLPFLGTATVILSLAWVLRGKPAAMALVCFGATLAATTLVLLFLTPPWAGLTAIVCDRLSLVHVACAALVLLAGATALALGRLRPGAGRLARLVAVGGAGFAGLALVAAAFPQCAGSPYAAFPEEIRYWLDHVAEARSLVVLLHGGLDTVAWAITLPIAALVAVGWQWIGAADRADTRWPALALLVLSGLALTAWQIRGVPYANLTAALALVPLAAAINERADGLERRWTRIGLRVSIPVLCIFAVVVPSWLDRSTVRQPEAENAGCDVRFVVAELTDPAGLGAEVRTLAAPIDKGPAILFLTRHKVLAAPYHRNVKGLSDNRRIFGGTEEEALATIRARDVGALLFCRKYMHVAPYGNRPAFLGERLAADDPPWWLVPAVQKDGMGLYRVHPHVRRPIPEMRVPMEPRLPAAQ